MFQTYGNIAIDPLMLRFRKYKCTWLTAISMVTVSLHYLPRRVRSTVSCNKTPATITQSEPFSDLLPCYYNAIKTNRRTIRSRLSCPASTGKGGDMSELQAHHCMTLQL